MVQSFSKTVSNQSPVTVVSSLNFADMTSTSASSSDPAVMEAINRGNAVVFLDVVLGGGKEDKSGGSPLGRIKLELFVKDVSE